MSFRLILLRAHKDPIYMRILNIFITIIDRSHTPSSNECHNYRLSHTSYGMSVIKPSVVPNTPSNMDVTIIDRLKTLFGMSIIKPTDVPIPRMVWALRNYFPTPFNMGLPGHIQSRSYS